MYIKLYLQVYDIHKIWIYIPWNYWLNKKMPLKALVVCPISLHTELHQSRIPLVLQVPPVPPKLVEPGENPYIGVMGPQGIKA